MNEKQRIILAPVWLLLLATLACNFPGLQRTPPAPLLPPPTTTPFVLPTTEPEASPQPTEPVAQPSESPPADEPTLPSAPTVAATSPPDAGPTLSPTLRPTARPTPTATTTPGAPSAGPLGLEEINPWDATCGQQFGDGRHEVLLRVGIIGGAPPFRIKHIDEVFVSSEREAIIVYVRAGCGRIVHEIAIESADGQRVSRNYAVPDPCCP